VLVYHRHMIRILLTALLALVIVACAPSGPGTRPGVEVDLGESIERLLDNGEFRAAAEALEKRAEAQPQQRNVFLVRAAEAWLAAQAFERAEATVARINPAALAREDRIRLDLVQAELAMRRGDLANAGWLLASTAERLPASLSERHAELEALLLELESSPVRDALDALQQAVEEPDFEGETALSLLLEFPLAELEGVLYEVSDQARLLPWLDLVITAREHLLDDEALGAALDSWESRWRVVDYPAAEARRWIAAWRQTRPLPSRVTVLLPDSGSPLHRPGEALREGLLAGWLQLTPDRRPQLEFRYIGEAPEDALSAWFDARENGTDFLIGPLGREQADALSRQPDAGLIPTLLLNLPDDPELLTKSAGEIMALALPPESEAELAAIHALATGHKRALVLSQYSSWGERVSRAFIDTFSLGGGRVVGERIYDPELPDHSILLKEVLEVDDSEARIARMSSLLGGSLESVAQRRTDIDLIFLGARANDGRLLRPQLEFFDAGDLTLMATSYIVDGAPRPERDRDLDGVTTPMPPWFLDFTPAGVVRERAGTLYDGLDNATLSRLHALGRDAMALLPWLAMMRADPTLELPGMVGRLSLPDGHIVRRDLPVIELRGGYARPARIDERETTNR
jgi:uncharacterized protein